MTSGETYAGGTHTEVMAAAVSAAVRADWAGLWDLRERLRATEQWTGFFDVACAIAGWHVDREAGRALFEEAIEAGFQQPELFVEELRTTFGTEPDWDLLQQRIHANVPPPPVELLLWPDCPPVLEPDLDRLDPEREALLRDRVPPPVDSAWQTAQRTLDWVTTRWEHANDHVDRPDAIEVLDRVAQGERFACVEFSIVLSQALNALAIPSRRVALRMRDHHTGVGRAHMVSEAWIDDLGRWVLLDGQNGAWWGSAEEPLGLLDLMRRFDHGDAEGGGEGGSGGGGGGGGGRPPMNSVRHEMRDDEQSLWFGYFASASTAELTWSGQTFVPIFQGRALSSARLVRRDRYVDPDLASVSTGLADDEGPALTFTPLHPYASGVILHPSGQPGHPIQLARGETFRLDATPGTYAYEVAAVTPYGALKSASLHFITRG